MAEMPRRERVMATMGTSVPAADWSGSGVKFADCSMAEKSTSVDETPSVAAEISVGT